MDSALTFDYEQSGLRGKLDPKGQGAMLGYCVPFTRGGARAVAAGLCIAASAASASASAAGPPVATYSCNIALSFFYLDLRNGNRCTTTRIAGPVEPCTYEFDPQTRSILFSLAERPELYIYRIRFVPAGPSTASPSERAPGLEAFEEPLEGPARSRGWCASG